MASKFKPGSVVWAKCGALFWPAEVMDFEKLPQDVKDDFGDAKKPEIVVKFFDEDGYEFLKNDKNLFPYNCDRKEEFIKKGIVKSRGKAKEGATSGWFAKFPQDVIRSEKLTGGDEKILEKDPYVERPAEKINYKEIFGDPKEKAKEKEKAAAGRKRKGGASSPASGGSPTKKKANKAEDRTPPRPISHPRFKPGASDQHQVRIMQQPSTPYHLDLQKKEEENKGSKGQGSSGYTCSICGFQTARMNVLVLHTKSHSESAKSAATTPASAKSPATTKTPTSGRGRGRPRGSTSSTPRSTPTKPAPVAKDTPKSTRGRGRGRPAGSGRKATESPTVSTTSESNTPAKEKKPRMSKKKKEQLEKEEKEKKIEQKNKILGEWDEEEDNEAEAEEKKKVKEQLGDADSDASDVESDQGAFFQDDNINNYHGDESDEELFVDEDLAKKFAEKEKAEEPPKSSESNNTNGKHDTNDKEDASIDVAKVLEETKVPELPDLETLSSPTSAKKSVKFSAQVAKEIAITKMALVQPKSNMAGPMEVEDEFAEAGEDEFSDAPRSSKTILKKRPSSPPPPPQPSTTESETDIPPPKEVTSTTEAASDVTSTESSAEPAESTAEPEVMEAQVTSSEVTSVTSSEDTSTSEAAATMLTLQGQQIQATPGPDGGHSEVNKEETYLLVVEDGQQLDQLNSQTFYIDSNSLANGDYSKMVLATSEAAAVQASHQEGTVAVETVPKVDSTETASME